MARGTAHAPLRGCAKPFGTRTGAQRGGLLAGISHSLQRQEKLLRASATGKNRATGLFRQSNSPVGGGLSPQKCSFLAVPTREGKGGFPCSCKLPSPKFTQAAACAYTCHAKPSGTPNCLNCRNRNQYKQRRLVWFSIRNVFKHHLQFQQQKEDQQKLCTHSYLKQILFPFHLDLHYENFLCFNPLLHKVYGAATAS